MLFACIKPFDPHIEGNVKNKYVVSGRVTSAEGIQEVMVSLSSPIEQPAFIPVSGCQVTILDDKGNSFPMAEEEPGTYRTWIGQDNLTTGTAYKLILLTPVGEKIESSYDTLIQAAPIDSVYFIIEEQPTSDPSTFIKGMQFYVDLDGNDLDSRNYKWEIVETYEQHAVYPLEYYYDGGFHKVDPPDSSNMYCWYTTMVKDVFTVSTKGLSRNAFHKYPLQFVEQHESRLAYYYSVLARQMGLSDGAYNYWEQIRINSNEQGGLYEKQPLAIKGNLVNLTNPENEVLGYFYACYESNKRYFYRDIEGLDLLFYDFCQEDGLGLGGWKDFLPFQYPIFYRYNELHVIQILTRECVDCTTWGGTNEKPDFWPY